MTRRHEKTKRRETSARQLQLQQRDSQRKGGAVQCCLPQLLWLPCNNVQGSEPRSCCARQCAMETLSWDGTDLAAVCAMDLGPREQPRQALARRHCTTSSCVYSSSVFLCCLAQSIVLHCNRTGELRHCVCGCPCVLLYISLI